MCGDHVGMSLFIAFVILKAQVNVASFEVVLGVVKISRNIDPKILKCMIPTIKKMEETDLYKEAPFSRLTR